VTQDEMALSFIENGTLSPSCDLFFPAPPRPFATRRIQESRSISAIYAPRTLSPRASVILTDGVIFAGVEGSPKYRQVLQK